MAVIAGATPAAARAERHAAASLRDPERDRDQHPGSANSHRRRRRSPPAPAPSMTTPRLPPPPRPPSTPTVPTTPTVPSAPATAGGVPPGTGTTPAPVVTAPAPVAPPAAPGTLSPVAPPRLAGSGRERASRPQLPVTLPSPSRSGGRGLHPLGGHARRTSRPRTARATGRQRTHADPVSPRLPGPEVLDGHRRQRSVPAEPAGQPVGGLARHQPAAALPGPDLHGGQAVATTCRGRCSPRSTRSRPTTAAT